MENLNWPSKRTTVTAAVFAGVNLIFAAWFTGGEASWPATWAAAGAAGSVYLGLKRTNWGNKRQTVTTQL